MLEQQLDVSFIYMQLYCAIKHGIITWSIILDDDLQVLLCALHMQWEWNIPKGIVVLII
jgi:hypothetical protein